MSVHTFDETKHPRDPSGQFTTKPAGESDLDLGSVHGAAADPTALRQAGLEALSRFDSSISGDRGTGSMRGLRSMMEQGLTSDDERAQRDGYLMAAAARREGVGWVSDDASTAMRGIAPHLSVDEVETSAERIDEALTREAQLLNGDWVGSHPEDEKVLVAYRACQGAQAVPAGDAHEAAAAYHDVAVREAERAVACSRERANPRVTVPAAPVPADPDYQEYRAGWDDEDVRARSRERHEIAMLAGDALFEGQGQDVAAHDVDPGTLASERMGRTKAAADITSVLVQRGLHRDEARDYATRITRAQALATFYEEGGADAMDAADLASASSDETVVGVDRRDVTDWVGVPPAEDAEEHGYWAEANREYWQQEATETVREALGHPFHYAPRN